MFKVHYFFLVFVYALFGITGYIRYGGELSYSDSGLLILNQDFSTSPFLYCNLLVVIFIGIGLILNFKPQKNLLTLIFRKHDQDSVLWHYLAVFTMHVVQVFFACIIVSYNLKVHKMLIFFCGIFSPFIKFIFPLIAFNKCFYFERKF